MTDSAAEATRRSGRNTIPRILPVLGTLLVATTAAAEDPIAGASYRNIISDQVANGARGAIAVNSAAGDSNLQANDAAIVFGRGIATTDLRQYVGYQGSALGVRSDLYIGGEAFNNTRGWLAINQAGGKGNAQGNGMAIAVGDGGALTEQSLEQVVAAQGALTDSDGDTTDQRTITVAPSTFRDARGVIQLNQSAGEGNANSNRFSLRVMGGAR
ncbi:MAG TPA: hypothetical protein VKA64_10650 [Gammaproteobacteria bacterium]|nr:hypothetical protein [Gammaproteobacteria bacterium]